MNNYVEVMAIVEGKTEKDFISKLVAPYLSVKGIYISAMEVNKPGGKGGDVKYSRVKKDINMHLRQRPDTVVTTFLDLYGIKEWPQKDAVMCEPDHVNKISKLYAATDTALKQDFEAYLVDNRIIPYFSIYEFEALLFSNPQILADKLKCKVTEITSIISTCGEPEKINSGPQTAPSKRLDELSPRNNFKKTSEGIAVATAIGIDAMREKCPQFNQWLERLESLVVVD